MIDCFCFPKFLFACAYTFFALVDIFFMPLVVKEVNFDDLLKKLNPKFMPQIKIIYLVSSKIYTHSESA